MKTLVVYYSKTGNARFIAQTVAAELGADLEEVVDLKKRDGALSFMSSGKHAMSGKGTDIAETKKKPADYDLVIVGQPVWAGNPTPAIRTYLSKNDLSGKKVALFFSDTNLSQAVEKTKALMPRSTFVGSVLAIKASEKSEETKKMKVKDWCETLKSA